MEGEFKKIVKKFPGWLDMLQKSPSLSRDQLGTVPNQGIYVYYDTENRPLYVGRSDRMKTRVLEHSRPSSGHTSATFGFILAKEKMQNPDQITKKSRTELVMDPAFSEKYHEAKNEISKMNVRVIEIKNPVEQALFEIYVSLELATPHNVWENH